MNGTPSWRASASPIWSSERYPLSISTRPSLRPERPWSSRAALSCSCEMSFCCSSRSPSRTRSGRLVLMASAMIFRSVTAQGDFRLSSRATLPRSRKRRKRPFLSDLAQLGARGVEQPVKPGGPFARQLFQGRQPSPRLLRVHPCRSPEDADRLAVPARKREKRGVTEDYRGHRVDTHDASVENKFSLETAVVEYDGFARDSLEIRGK